MSSLNVKVAVTDVLSLKEFLTNNGLPAKVLVPFVVREEPDDKTTTIYSFVAKQLDAVFVLEADEKNVKSEEVEDLFNELDIHVIGGSMERI